MNIKYLTLLAVLFLCCIFGFEETSYSLNKVSQNDISELKILKYLPKDNKAFFLSNTKSTKIPKAIRTNFEITNQDELVLVKNSILAYLGVDLGTNKLKDIYNNELAITTHDNKEKEIDDVLIIFKIKENKDIDDIDNEQKEQQQRSLEDKLRKEVSELKQENNELKQETSELKSENNELKQETSELKSETSELKSEISELRKRRQIQRSEGEYEAAGG